MHECITNEFYSELIQVMIKSLKTVSLLGLSNLHETNRQILEKPEHMNGQEKKGTHVKRM